MIQRLRHLACLLLVIFITAPFASAHEVRPSYLELVETEPDTWAVTWKQPITNGKRLKVDPVLPEHCAETELSIAIVEGTLIQRWKASCSLGSGEISITGLSRTLTDAFVVVKHLSGETRSSVLRGNAPVFSLSEAATGAPVGAYLRMGIVHILEGHDHLLFVLGLILIVQRSQLILTITAFTIAHSLTLGLVVTTGWSLPSSPVEIVIALSIVLLGVEAIRKLRGTASITTRLPWLVAFGFGLIHGLGFAGALSEIGLPANAELLSLAMFNIGVEIGQLIFLGVLLILAWSAERALKLGRAHIQTASAYLVGIAGSYWVIERVYGAAQLPL